MALPVSLKATVLAAFLLLYIVKKLVQYHRLRDFKGPPGSGITDWWHSLAYLTGKSHEWYASASERYGPITRVAPNLLITSSPEVWMHVNGTKSRYKRSDWFYKPARFGGKIDNVFSQTDNTLHEERRRQMAPGYSGKENPELESGIDTPIEQLIRLLKTKYLSSDAETKPVDMAEKLSFLTLDVISTVGLGKSFGMLEADQDVNDYIKSAEEGLWFQTITVGLGISWILRLPFISTLFQPSTTDSTGFGKMMSTAYCWVDDRMKQPTDSRSDMLASFRHHGLTHQELRHESLLQITAGSDTSAATLKAIMLYLMVSPRVLSKLQREIDVAVSSGKAPLPPGIVSAAQTNKLPYLQAVIREGMRVWPPVTDTLPRDVPSGADTVFVNGRPVSLPHGVEIGYSAIAMHHDKELYGEDAQCFRPERWLIEDKEKLAAMVRTNELIFGSGRWHCLGQPVAQMEISKAIFELIRHFDWVLIDPERPWKAMNYMGLFSVRDLWVSVTER